MSYAATGAIGKSRGHVQVRAPCSSLSIYHRELLVCIVNLCSSIAANPWAHVLRKIVSQSSQQLPRVCISLVYVRTELIRRMKRFQVANHACLMIKYAKDVRYDQNGVSTHDRSVLLS